MHKAYQNNNTKIWLDAFTDEFPKFIHEMHFEDFVDENYEVLDIEKGQQKAIAGNLQCLREKAKSEEGLEKYMKQLLALDNVL